MLRETVALTVGFLGGMGAGVILFHTSKYAFVGVEFALLLITIYIMYNTQSSSE